MTATERLERDLSEWFAETAAPRTPDYTEDILRRAARVRQRPRWTFLERWLPMSVISMGRQALRPVPWRTVGLLAALLLLLVVAVTVYVGGQRRVPRRSAWRPTGRSPSSRRRPATKTRPATTSRSATSSPSIRRRVPRPRSSGARARRRAGVRPRRHPPVVRPPGAGRHAAVRRRRRRRDADAADEGPAARHPGGRLVARRAFGGVHRADRRGSDLWIAATDGSGARRLDLGDVSAISPQWRPPDGRELLFVGSEAPGLEARRLSRHLRLRGRDRARPVPGPAGRTGLSRSRRRRGEVRLRLDELDTRRGADRHPGRGATTVRRGSSCSTRTAMSSTESAPTARAYADAMAPACRPTARASPMPSSTGRPIGASTSVRSTVRPGPRSPTTSSWRARRRCAGRRTAGPSSSTTTSIPGRGSSTQTEDRHGRRRGPTRVLGVAAEQPLRRTSGDDQPEPECKRMTACPVLRSPRGIGEQR